MKKFDKNLIDRARKMFFCVYMDEDTGSQYIGHKTGYCADRVRIYPTDWHYESEEIARTNEELKQIIRDYSEEE